MAQIGGTNVLVHDLQATTGQEVWLVDDTGLRDSNILLTLSSPAAESTVLIRSSGPEKVKSKDFVQAPPERVQSKKVRKFTKIQKATQILGYALTAIMLTFVALSSLGIVKAAVVLTGSMEPTINPGDIVVMTSPQRLTPQIGSIVEYQGRRFDGTAVAGFTHRIIGGYPNTGFLMKGDANPSPDTQQPTMKDILGVVMFTVPFVGKILNLKMMILIGGFLTGVWLIANAAKS